MPFGFPGRGTCRLSGEPDDTLGPDCDSQVLRPLSCLRGPSLDIQLIGGGQLLQFSVNLSLLY